MAVTELAPGQRAHTDVSEVFGPEWLGQSCFEPFSVDVLSFLEGWSRAILADPATRAFPDLAAFGFWIRKSAVGQLQARLSGDPHNHYLPRGVALHVAPANVDTVFLYSLVVSLLCGNLNIVRVSSRRGESQEVMLGPLRTALARPENEAVAKRSCILTYEHSDAVNRYLAGVADVRVIWGGDATVQSFRALPAKPAANDIVFPDRMSACAIAADAYLVASPEQRRCAADGFFRDAYLFDQKACSSPSFVYFVGNPESCDRASTAFWHEVRALLELKRASCDMSLQVEHLVFACEQLANHPGSSLRDMTTPGPKVLHVASADRPVRMCGGGFFIERFVPQLAALAECAHSADQTMTYLGFDTVELGQLVRALRGTGWTRFVPIGQALAFDARWDGYDLLREFTRLVAIT